MSRIGSTPISIGTNVTVNINGSDISVSGPQGSLNLVIQPGISVEILGSEIVVKRANDLKLTKSLHGLTRSLLSNMVLGVTKGWEKRLELIGVGYRAQTSGEKLILNVGYSHPVEITAPTGVKFAVIDNTKITVSGFDRHLVGQVAATVRDVKKPEPYQGKGIRYVGEYVRRKAGKAGKVGAGAK